MLHFQTQILPSHSRTLAQMHGEGEAGKEGTSFCSSPWRVFSGSGSPRVTGRWEADMSYQTAGHQCEHCDPEKRLDLCYTSSIYSISSKWTSKNRQYVFYSLCWTTALFILHHYVLMELCGEKINRGELPDSREREHTCAHKSTLSMRTDKQGLAGWALPVEPVVCVAWKWERVIAAEVVAGIGILKGPNGCINNNNNKQQHWGRKQKDRGQRGSFHSELLTCDGSLFRHLDAPDRSDFVFFVRYRAC